MEWISIEKELPNALETVWLLNIITKDVFLGCCFWDNQDGWSWAKSNGLIYSEENKIVSECESDDDYCVTHWIALPQLPTTQANYYPVLI